MKVSEIEITDLRKMMHFSHHPAKIFDMLHAVYYIQDVYNLQRYFFE
jgi:hypothetical protein